MPQEQPQTTTTARMTFTVMIVFVSIAILALVVLTIVEACRTGPSSLTKRKKDEIDAASGTAYSETTVIRGGDRRSAAAAAAPPPPLAGEVTSPDEAEVRHAAAADSRARMRGGARSFREMQNGGSDAGQEVDPSGALTFQSASGMGSSDVGALSGLAVSASSKVESDKWKHLDASRLLPGGGGSAVPMSRAFAGEFSQDADDIEIDNKAQAAMGKLKPSTEMVRTAAMRSTWIPTMTNLLTPKALHRNTGQVITAALRPGVSTAMMTKTAPPWGATDASEATRQALREAAEH